MVYVFTYSKTLQIKYLVTSVLCVIQYTHSNISLFWGCILLWRHYLIIIPLEKSKIIFKFVYAFKLFVWTYLSRYLCMIGKLYFPNRGFVYVFLIFYINLFGVIKEYLYGIGPSCCWLYHVHPGEEGLFQGFTFSGLISSHLSDIHNRQVYI